MTVICGRPPRLSGEGPQGQVLLDVTGGRLACVTTFVSTWCDPLGCDTGRLGATGDSRRPAPGWDGAGRKSMGSEQREEVAHLPQEWVGRGSAARARAQQEGRGSGGQATGHARLKAVLGPRRGQRACGEEHRVGSRQRAAQRIRQRAFLWCPRVLTVAGIKLPPSCRGS